MGIRKYCKFGASLVGTKSFLESYNKILHNIANLISKTTPKSRPNNKIHMIAHHGNGQVAKIAAFLYKDATIFLDRKFNVIKELI